MKLLLAMMIAVMIQTMDVVVPVEVEWEDVVVDEVVE